MLFALPLLLLLLLCYCFYRQKLKAIAVTMQRAKIYCLRRQTVKEQQIELFLGCCGQRTNRCSPCCSYISINFFFFEFLLVVACGGLRWLMVLCCRWQHSMLATAGRRRGVKYQNAMRRKHAKKYNNNNSHILRLKAITATAIWEMPPHNWWWRILLQFVAITLWHGGASQSPAGAPARNRQPVVAAALYSSRLRYLKKN